MATGCCGRPSNRTNKGRGGAADYYAQYAYLSGHQRAKQLEQQGSKCPKCDAITMGNPCSICGINKTESEETKEG